MPPTKRPFPRFIADASLESSPYGRWEERLRGSGANNAVWSSPVLSEDKLYIVNQNGDVFVLRAGGKFEVIAMNSLGERSNSSVVPSNACGPVSIRF